MVFVLEVRLEGQRVGGGDAQALRHIRRSAVAACVVPSRRAEREGHEIIVVPIEDVEYYLAFVVEA